VYVSIHNPFSFGKMMNPPALEEAGDDFDDAQTGDERRGEEEDVERTPT
jgi:hypothetical protein